MKKHITFLLFIGIAVTAMGQRTAEDYAREGADKLEALDYYGAMMDFTKAIKLTPEWDVLYKAHFGKGLAHVYMGDYKKGKIEFDQAIKVFPNDALLYNWRGYTKYKLKRQPGSEIVDYDRAILLKPDYAEAFFNRGWSHWDLGKTDAACNDWYEAYSLGFEKALKPLKEHCGY